MSPAPVLLHGFTHTGASWDPVLARLGERYLPLAPDIRGHGASSRLVPVDLPAVLQDISGLAPSSFTLVGYSMGGRIALHAALALGDRVDRLVLIGASPGIADPAEREARRVADQRLAERIERSRIEEFVVAWATTPVLGEQPPEVAAAAHADRLRNTPWGLARALRGLGTGALPSLWDRLGELRIPVTLVVGERDHKFAGLAEQMASRMAQPETVIVPGAGHAVHLEAPERTAAIIAAAGPC
jgi:2-succinyl-6-hydroxy-2,4-cyclohexadiene-1-carboxylate synthase